MIKLLKIDNLIYTNVEESEVEEYLQDLETFRKHTIDTINWWIGNKVKKATGDVTKLSAANSKAIVLLTKLLKTLTPDTSTLTELEKSAWDKLLVFADTGYADSELLNNSLQAVQSYTQQGGDAISKALNATTIEELIGILNELEV